MAVQGIRGKDAMTVKNRIWGLSQWIFLPFACILSHAFKLSWERAAGGYQPVMLPPKAQFARNRSGPCTAQSPARPVRHSGETFSLRRRRGNALCCAIRPAQSALQLSGKRTEGDKRRFRGETCALRPSILFNRCKHVYTDNSPDRGKRSLY